MYLIDSPWFCWVSVRFCIGFGWIYSKFLEPYSWDHGSGGRGGGGEGGGRGGGGEEGEEGEEEGEGEGGQQNWSCGKKFPLLPCLVQVCYCYSGACKGGTLCGPVFLLFLIRV